MKPKNSLSDCFSMFWGDLEAQLAAADLAEYRRLCDPHSNDYILDDPDYCGLIIHSFFRAKVPES